MREANTEYPVHQLIAARWSPCQFAVDRPVGDADLASLFEAARWAASSFNAQPWHYIVAKREDRAEFKRILNCLTEGNRPWARYAGVLALGIARLDFAHNGKTNVAAVHDLGAASAQLTLEAGSRGLHVHQMAGILHAEIRREFSVPEGFEPVTGIAIGYHAPNEELPAKYRERDQAPRLRRPLTEFVFTGAWAAPADLEAGGGA